MENHMNSKHRKCYPFQCELCQKKYPSKTTYNRHMKEHSNMRHDCSECDKKFRTYWALREHRIAYHSAGDAQFACECGAAYKWRPSLERHLKKTGHKKQEKSK